MSYSSGEGWLVIPDCPYIRGFRAQIQPHNPPAPYGTHLYDGRLPKCDVKNWDGSFARSRLHANVQYPPLEPPSHESSAASSQRASSELEIIEVIAGGEDRGAQVVRCKISDAKQPGGSYEAVAKIYDSVYYDVYKYNPEVECCLMHRADRDYSCEAAVYQALDGARHKTAGTFTPRYHGSWTFNLSHASSDVVPGQSGDPVERPVRMILIEYISGCSVLDLGRDEASNEAQDVRAVYSEAYRLEIWRQFLRARVYFKHAGLYNPDETPRNVMLTPRPEKQMTLSKQPSTRLVLIDFNVAVVWMLTKQFRKTTLRLAKPPALPENPMKRCWSSAAENGFETWVPDWYQDGVEARRAWLLKKKQWSVSSVPAPRSWLGWRGCNSRPRGIVWCLDLSSLAETLLCKVLELSVQTMRLMLAVLLYM